MPLDPSRWLLLLDRRRWPPVLILFDSLVSSLRLAALCDFVTVVGGVVHYFESFDARPFVSPFVTSALSIRFRL